MTKFTPSETIQKIQLFARGHFVGEYIDNDCRFAHAWPKFGSQKFEKFNISQYERACVIVFTFETVAYEKGPGVIVPDYSGYGDIASVLLTLLYGKLIENCGSLENDGMFCVPDLSLSHFDFDDKLPFQSSKPRDNFPIPLNFVEIKRIIPLLNPEAPLDSKFITAFYTASKFYKQALSEFSRDPEIAYLHLITACEVVSNFYDYTWDIIADDHAKSIVECLVNEGSKKAARIASFIKVRTLGIKRKFTKCIVDEIDDAFYVTSPQLGGFTKANFEPSIKAAYDLRSKYVHTGIGFGKWIMRPMAGQFIDVSVGSPVVADDEMRRILAKAPSFFGLERVVRVLLFRFAEKNGVKIS